MSSKAEGKPNGMLYEVRVRGHLDRRWSKWFGGMSITHVAGGETIFVGPVVDQAALHGLLNQVNDLGLVLIAVRRVEPEEARTDRAEDAPVDPTESGESERSRPS